MLKNSEARATMEARSIWEHEHKCGNYETSCDFCGEFGCGECLGIHKVPWLDEPTVEPLNACNKCYTKITNANE
jgi:hypothetical protein